MSIRTIMDARFNDTSASTLDMVDRERCADWLADALGQGVDTVVVVGDDASLAALATAYHSGSGSAPLSFALVAAGSVNVVAQAVDAERASSRALARTVRNVERGAVKATQVPTLRVVDSMETGARLSFGFGMGAINELFDGKSRIRRRDAVKQAFRQREVTDADVFVDFAPSATSFGFLIASSLRRSWGGVEMGNGTTLRIGASPLELVRGATRLGRVVERATGGSAQPFQRVHIDTNSDYVVDGVSCSSTKSRVVALTPGPQVRVLVAS